MKSGEILEGRFRIEEMAGAGAMGTVYRATDLLFEETVAVKVLNITDERIEERFGAEADILKRMNHPGIVRLIDNGITPEKRPFMVMEFLEGIELQDRLQAGDMLEVEDTIAMIRRVADALGVAHRMGIVHRDLKPANLFLVQGDPRRVKVLDFGVARQMRAEKKMTATGTTIGTPQYMSPEQASGKPVDARSDVFSLGSVLFECLVGRPAFEGETIMAVLTAILLGEPPRLADFRADLPIELSDTLGRMLCKDVSARLSDGHAVSRALATLGKLQGARPQSEGYKILTLTGAERRFVCLVVVGVMQLTSDADVGDTVAEYDVDAEVQRLRSIAGMFGGRLDQTQDGSLAAVLDTIGVPQQQVERAARCALRFREQVADSPIVLVSGWGDLADESALQNMIAGAVARYKDGTAQGVVVDEDTSRLLSDRFDIETDASKVILRGERTRPAAARNVLGKPTRCVGRARELAMLETTFHQCADEEETAAVLVIGEPGIGKSRLLVELLDRVDQQHPDAVVLYGRGDPISGGGTYGLLRPVFRNAAKIRAGDDPATQYAALLEYVSEWVDDDPDFVADFLGEIAGIDTPDAAKPRLRAARHDPALMASQTRQAFVTFMAALAEEEVVLLVLDDLHSGDEVSLNFIDALLGELDDEESEASLMVLGLGRPETIERFQSLWKERGVSQLELGRLSPKASRRLVAAVLGDTIEKPVIRELVHRSEGNPYYLEELIRATGRSGGTLEGLPESVLGMVQARMDALSGDARIALRAGSVFGPTFWGSGIVSLMGGDGRAVAVGDAVQEALDAEFIRVDEDSKFEDEVSYSFATPTVQEAAYAMLTETDKELGHRLAAEWLTDRGEDDPRILAEHLERGGKLEESALQWLQAATEALEANHMPGVLAAAERGVANGQESETLGRLKVLAAEAAEWAGDSERAEKEATEALNLLPAGDERWFSAMSNLMLASCRLGWVAKSSDHANEMVATEPVDDDARARKVVALCRGALNAMWCGRYDLARKQGQNAEDNQKPLQGYWPLALARLKHAEAYWNLHRGRTGAALPLFIEAASSWELAGDARSLTGVRTNVGFACGLLGRFEEAEKWLTEQMARAQELGLTPLYHVCRHNLATVYAQRGQVDAAIEMKEPAVAWLSRAGHPRLDGNVIASLGQVLLSAGRAEEAYEKAHFAAQMLGPFAPTHAYALAVEASALVALNRHAEAVDVAAEGIAILDRLEGIEEGEALLRLAWAEALLGADRRDEAIAAITTAADRLHDRADTITDPDHRVMFLQHVPENEKTLTQYELLS